MVKSDQGLHDTMKHMEVQDSRWVSGVIKGDLKYLLQIFEHGNHIMMDFHD